MDRRAFCLLREMTEPGVTSPTPQSRRALLLLDLQDGVCREDGEIGRHGLGAQVTERDVLGHARSALTRARELGLFVAYARVAFDDGYTMLTSRARRLQSVRRAGLARASGPGAAICDEIRPAASELVVDKRGIDPLVGTALLPALIGAGVTELALGGVATDHVVESAARHAADLGFNVTVLEDLCASMTLELHRHAIEETLPYYAYISDWTSYLDDARS